MNFKQSTVVLSAFVSIAFILPGMRADAQTIAFSYTGANQTYIVPDGITAISVKLWGGGGGISGGSGAFVSGMLTVIPDSTLTLIVGGAGSGGFGSGPTVYGGGGSCYGVSDVLASSGGGCSAIQLNGSELVTAGGGGGGTYYTRTSATYSGGGGGILVGGNGTSANSGTGGTQTQGGSTPNYGITGSFLTGGNSQGRGAGGGGGYYGGGGGWQVGEKNLYAGGGGSSYTGDLSQIFTQAGSDGSSGTVLPGGASDPDYVSGVGIGGFANVGGTGGYGRIVMTAIHASATSPEPSSFLFALLGTTVVIVRRQTLRAASKRCALLGGCLNK